MTRSNPRTEGAPAVDWPSIRKEFAAVGERAYLNTASYGPPPRVVDSAVRAALDAWSDGTGAWRDWEDRAMESRALFAEFLGGGARPEEIALVSSLSAAASQVAASLPAPAPRANIVVGADEFRSNLFPWMNQAERGFDVRLVPYRGGRLDPEDVIAALDDDTVLVAVSHVQSATGYRIDLASLAAACASRPDTRLFVDATQSLGALRVPLAGVDFVAAAAYKWMLSPRGAAFLWVRASRLEEQTPLAPSWKTPRDPFVDYYGGPYDPAPRASALDASLAWPVWQGTTAALEFLCALGADAIEARDQALAGRFRAGLPALGLEPLFDEHESSPIVAVRIPEPERIKASLSAAGVVAAVRAGYLRTSFHFFNDEDDVDRALAALGAGG